MLRIAVGVFVVLAISISAFYLAQFRYEMLRLDAKTATGFAEAPIIGVKNLRDAVQQRLLPNDTINPFFVEQYINNARAQNKLGPLRHNTELTASAQSKLNDLVTNNYFAHTSPTGMQPWNFITKSGYDYQKAGENLAKGQFKDEQEIVDDWMDSPEHREVILNPNFCDIGIGVAKAKTFLDQENIYIIVMHVGYRTTSSIDACSTKAE